MDFSGDPQERGNSTPIALSVLRPALAALAPPMACIRPAFGWRSARLWVAQRKALGWRRARPWGGVAPGFGVAQRFSAAFTQPPNPTALAAAEPHPKP